MGLSRRPEAAARHRARTHPLPRAAVPRRAVDRARPAEPGEPVAAHPRPARAARHDDLRHHPLPRGGRPLRRAGHGHGQRAGDRRRHRARAEGAARRRRHHARASQTARPQAATGSAAPCVDGHDRDPHGAGRRAPAAQAHPRAGWRWSPPRCASPPSTTSSSGSPDGRCARRAAAAEADRGLHRHEGRGQRMSTTDRPRHAVAPVARHLERPHPRAAAGRPRPVLADLQPRAAAGVPRAVRPAAGRRLRCAGQRDAAPGSCRACSS